jgi:hypothetical protein
MEESSLPDQVIYFIPYMKKELYKFDTNTHRISLAYAPEDLNLGYGPHLCMLSETRLFMQGGIVELEFIADSYILDITTGEFTEKAYGPINAAGGSVLYKGNYYIFGGATKDIYGPSSLSQKYCVDEDYWTHISPLPVSSYNNTSAVFDDKIAIVGQHLSSLYMYDLGTDSYHPRLDLDGPYKIVLSHNGVLYVLLSNSIQVLENEVWNAYPQPLGAIFTLVYSYPVVRNNYIYFIIPAQTVLRLNMDTKVLEKVSTSS